MYIVSFWSYIYQYVFIVPSNISTCVHCSQQYINMYSLFSAIYQHFYPSDRYLPPWQKEAMFLVSLVCLSACLFVCGQHYSKTYERMGMKFHARLLGGTMQNWFKFGGDLCLLRWLNEQKKRQNSCSMIRCGAGNDTQALGLAFHNTFFILLTCYKPASYRDWGEVSLSPPSQYLHYLLDSIL